MNKKNKNIIKYFTTGLLLIALHSPAQTLSSFIVPPGGNSRVKTPADNAPEKIINEGCNK
jgi:hypothetical protein